jgi:hypothetical protein
MQPELCPHPAPWRLETKVSTRILKRPRREKELILVFLVLVLSSAYFARDTLVYALRTYVFGTLFQATSRNSGIPRDGMMRVEEGNTRPIHQDTKEAQEEQVGMSPRTLLIIQGAYRTFDFAVDSIIENLIKTNWPCDVVVSLDRAPSQNGSTKALEKLQQYMLAGVGIIYPSPGEDLLPANVSSIEFIQHYRALTRVDTSAYTFIMKTRTDVVIQQPLAFTTALGHDETRFRALFPRFVQELLAHDPTATPADVIYTWYMTAGNTFYIRHMYKRNIHMSWSPVGPHDIVHALRDAVNKRFAAIWDNPSNSGDTGDTGRRERQGRFPLLQNSGGDDNQLRHLIQDIASEQHVMYMVGNTWVGFGFREDFLPVYETIYNDFGSFSWNKWRGPGWDGSHAWTKRDTITESHFRLSHLHHNKSLIDLMNLVDHQVTFMRGSQCFGHHYLSAAKGLAVYILREWQVTCRKAASHQAEEKLPLQALDPREIYEEYEYDRR